MQEYGSDSEEDPFIDLSAKELNSIREEPGYYGFYDDHDPSKFISPLTYKVNFQGSIHAKWKFMLNR